MIPPERSERGDGPQSLLQRRTSLWLGQDPPPSNGSSPFASTLSLIKIVVLFAWSGFFCGALEFLFGSLNTDWGGTLSSLFVFSFTAGLLGFCGILFGAAAGLLIRFAKKPLPSSILFALLILILLAPLFTGRTMALAFSTTQILLIFSLTVILVFFISSLCFFPLWGQRDPKSLLAIGQVLAALLIASLFSETSSIFLIRLWGLHTLQYLQVVFIVFQVFLLALGMRWLIALLKPTLFLRMKLPFLGTLLLFLVCLVVPVKNSDFASQTLKRAASKLPNVNLLVSTLASVVDFDGDDYSPIFGFGDCDDFNKEIHPNAVDIPGNGLDENCFNGDLKSIQHHYYNRSFQISPPARKTLERRKLAFLIIVDTFRFDAVDFTTGLNSKTPHIAQIAKEGIHFERAYAQSNNTLQSFPYFLHLNFRNLPGHIRNQTLASHLKRGNVASVGILQADVEKWWDHDLDSVFFGFDRFLRGEKNTRNRPTLETAELTLKQKNWEPNKDLFVMTDFEILHDFFTQNVEGVRMTEKGLNLSDLVSLWNIPKLVTRMKKRYADIVGEIDLVLGTLWAEIKKMEENADILLILTSDHGEEFYEHGGLFHVGNLHEEVVHIPLIVYRTGMEPRVETKPAALYQIVPTLLDFFGFESPLLKDLSLLNPPAENLEIFAHFTKAKPYKQRIFMVLEGDFKLIYNLAQAYAEMYDLKADPGEKINIFSKPLYSEIEGRLMEKMDTLLFYMNYGDQGRNRR